MKIPQLFLLPFFLVIFQFPLLQTFADVPLVSLPQGFSEAKTNYGDNKFTISNVSDFDVSVTIKTKGSLKSIKVPRKKDDTPGIATLDLKNGVPESQKVFITIAMKDFRKSIEFSFDKSIHVQHIQQGNLTSPSKTEGTLHYNVPVFLTSSIAELTPPSEKYKFTSNYDIEINIIPQNK